MKLVHGDQVKDILHSELDPTGDTRKCVSIFYKQTRIDIITLCCFLESSEFFLLEPFTGSFVSTLRSLVL